MFSWLTNAWRFRAAPLVIFTGISSLTGWLREFSGSGIAPRRSRPSSTPAAAAGRLRPAHTFSGFSALALLDLRHSGSCRTSPRSIILQLMTVVVPTLDSCRNEGESGYAKINQYTRYLTIFLPLRKSLGTRSSSKKKACWQANTAGLVLIVSR